MERRTPEEASTLSDGNEVIMAKIYDQSAPISQPWSGSSKTGGEALPVIAAESEIPRSVVMDIVLDWPRIS